MWAPVAPDDLSSVARPKANAWAKKLKELGLKLQRLRQEGGKAMLTYVRQDLQGHFNYYGVSGNSRSINVYGYHAAKVLLKWLNRRSQRPSVTWELFYQLLREGLLPKPRIIHNLYPKPLWMT
jgi:RNA-directed DNA polymerase